MHLSKEQLKLRSEKSGINCYYGKKAILELINDLKDIPEVCTVKCVFNNTHIGHIRISGQRGDYRKVIDLFKKHIDHFILEQFNLRKEFMKELGSALGLQPSNPEYDTYRKAFERTMNSDKRGAKLVRTTKNNYSYNHNDIS